MLCWTRAAALPLWIGHSYVLGGYAYSVPLATTTADPATCTESIRSGVPVARARIVEGRPISTPWRISIHSPNGISPCRAKCTGSDPAAEPVAASSTTP